MKVLDITKYSFLFICFLLIFSVLLSKELYAERFFKQHNTWYEKIPFNPKLLANSANYVDDILINGSQMYGNLGYFSVPIFHAAVDTPITTVYIRTQAEGSESYMHKDYIEAQHWNDVPIPSNALPAGNAEGLAGGHYDGHLVIISFDNKYSWEFYKAQKRPDGSWLANSVRKWDLSGPGINSPYDKHSSQRAASVPLLHGLITYDEVAKGSIDHALAFCYHGETIRTHWALYPTEKSLAGISSRPWAMKLGERIQLDPTVNCNSLGLKPFGLMVCVALQEYGMIFVENTGPGDNYVFMEYMGGQTRKWSDLGIKGSELRGIPLSKLRIIEPLVPPFSSSTTPSDDTTPPAPPMTLEIK